MKRQSLSAAQSSHPGANSGRAHRNRSRSDSPGSAEVRGVLKELDRMVGELQRQVALDDGSDEARLAIAASRRDLAQRLEDVLKRIAPAIEASEYHVPGISEQFGGIWLDRPEIIQGARTWLAYAGRVRQVLIRALEDHPSGAPAGALTSAATNGARTSAATGKVSSWSVAYPLSEHQSTRPSFGSCFRAAATLATQFSSGPLSAEIILRLAEADWSRFGPAASARNLSTASRIVIGLMSAGSSQLPRASLSRTMACARPQLLVWSARRYMMPPRVPSQEIGHLHRHFCESRPGSFPPCAAMQDRVCRRKIVSTKHTSGEWNLRPPPTGNYAPETPT